MRAGLAAADADLFWASRYRVTDQFLLYCFAAHSDTVPGQVLDELRGRAETIGDLHLRVSPGWGDLAFPRWREAPIDDDAFEYHPMPKTWDECREAIAVLLGEGLDATERTWRAHLFGPVRGAPDPQGSRAGGPAIVVVLQVSHALADGRGATELARTLLSEPAAPVEPPAVGRAKSGPPPSGRDGPGAADLAAAALGAAALPVRLAAGVGLGLLAWGRGTREYSGDPAPALLPATALNREPGVRRRVDLIVTNAAAVRIGGSSVTASVLVVLAEVLTRLFGAVDPALTVELMIARPEEAAADDAARNRFFTAGVALHPELAPAARVRAIAAGIAAARRRDASPARQDDRRAAALTPPLLRALGVRMGAAAPPPERVTGATVVSSVNRGPADLWLAGGQVQFTAGFPALSAAHAMTVGIHGLGSTVTVSITTDPDVVDADRIVGLLRTALHR